MGRKCQISGVSRQSGHNVSHANNKTKRVFRANLQTKKIYVSELKKSIRLRLSTRMIRTIDRIGFTAALKKHNVTLAELT
jgi:large subunit ribosomal protein L28